MRDLPTNTTAVYRHCRVAMCDGACLECNVANRAERRIVEWLRVHPGGPAYADHFRNAAQALAVMIERGEHRA